MLPKRRPEINYTAFWGADRDWSTFATDKLVTLLIDAVECYEALQATPTDQRELAEQERLIEALTNELNQRKE